MTSFRGKLGRAILSVGLVQNIGQVKVYISVFLSTESAYRRIEREASINDALNVLRGLDRTDVFFTPSSGGYSLVKDGTIWTTGVNIAGVAELSGCVYYFRDETKSIAEQVKTALGDRIKYFQKRTPYEHQLQERDVLEYSGIDVEVIL